MQAKAVGPVRRRLASQFTSLTMQAKAVRQLTRRSERTLGQAEDDFGPRDARMNTSAGRELPYRAGDMQCRSCCVPPPTRSQ
jgi:hypothetical protein